MEVFCYNKLNKQVDLTQNCSVSAKAITSMECLWRKVCTRTNLSYLHIVFVTDFFTVFWLLQPLEPLTNPSGNLA